MPEKQKTRDRKEAHTVLAAVAMTVLLGLWNTFANHDRHRVEAASPSDLTPALENGITPDICVTAIPVRNLGTRCMTITRTRSS